MVAEKVQYLYQSVKHAVIEKTDGKLISQHFALRKSVTRAILVLLKVFKLQFWMSYFNVKMFRNKRMFTSLAILFKKYEPYRQSEGNVVSYL